MRDPRNVGAAFRIADALGVGLVLAGTTPRPPNRKIAKTARATVATVATQYEENAANYLDALGAGTLVLALEWTNASHNLYDYRLPKTVRCGQQKLLLIPGREDSGLAPELLERANAAVHLPMFGRNSSLNVSVALGAALYLLLRQFDGQ